MKQKLCLLLILVFNHAYSQTADNSKIPQKLTISQAPTSILIDQKPYEGLKFREVFVQYREEYKIINENRYNGEINYIKSGENLNRAFYQGRMGFIDKKNKVVIPFLYKFNEETSHLSFRDVMILQKGNFWGLVNLYNQVIIPFDNQILRELYTADNLYLAKKNNKIGVYDSYGNIKIPFAYDSLLAVSNNAGMILLKDGKAGIISLNNKIIIPFEYKFIKALKDKPYFYAIKQNSSNILDENYKSIFKKDYSSFYELPTNHLFASYQNKYGIIDYKENIIVPFAYDFFLNEIAGSGGSNSENHCYVILKNKKVGLYDFEAKKEIIEPIYEQIVPLNNDYYWIKKDGKGQIYKNEFVAFPTFFKTISYKNDLISFTDVEDKITNFKWQDKKLVVLKESDEKRIGYDKEYIVKNNKWGFESSKKDFVIKPIYDSLSRWEQFSNPLFFAKKNGKCGIIDKDSKEFIPIEFDEIKQLAYFESDPRTFAIRKKDKWAIYDYIEGYISEFKYKKVKYLNSYSLYYLDGVLYSRIGNAFVPYKKK